jgi:hypothetical protein
MDLNAVASYELLEGLAFKAAAFGGQGDVAVGGFEDVSEILSGECAHDRFLGLMILHIHQAV